MKATFSTTVLQAEGKNATGLRIPAEVIAALSASKKPPVVVTIAGYTYRSTVAVYGDAFLVSLSQEHRRAAGVEAGDGVEVTLELDREPRTVVVPDDLAAALGARPGAMEAFDALAYSARKEHVRQVKSAKAQATRERRITAIVEKLG